jgi:hypothetical protein
VLTVVVVVAVVVEAAVVVGGWGGVKEREALAFVVPLAAVAVEDAVAC